MSPQTALVVGASGGIGQNLIQHLWDVLLSATKVQQTGFHQVVDSEEMFMSLFQSFRDRRIIPAANSIGV